MKRLEAIPAVLVISCPQGSIPFPQSRRSAQSPNPHFDSCPRSLRRLDYCLRNRSGWDLIGRRNTADQCCSSGRPQCLPCTPVSMWGYCPIRRPSSTFMPFQCWSISSTLLDQQHHKRSLDTAGLHSILEPVGLDSGDGRRPDGVTSFPFKGGKALAWDATCTNSFSASNLYSTILNPGSASSAAEDLKRRKYPQLVADCEFVPVAVETSGIIGSAGCSLLTDIGAAFRGPPMIPARCLTSFNRFQLPSSEATPWLLQPHQGNISRSWLRDTDSQNGDALLCIYYINFMYSE